MVMVLKKELAFFAVIIIFALVISLVAFKETIWLTIQNKFYYCTPRNA
jgi:hypothetical protein